MRPNRRRQGYDGERRAEAFLTGLGYRMVARNVTLPGGEIDLVGVDGETLVFVEVKKRMRSRFGSALAGVDARKRARLRAVASEYAQIVAPRARIRFDVVAIDGNRLRLYRNAF